MRKRGKKENKPLFEKETDLFAPVKIWLEKNGLEVQGEIGGVDIYACRLDTSSPEKEDAQTENPPSSGACDKIIDCTSPENILSVGVELKLKPSLELVLQAVERISSADLVYIAFPENKKAGEMKKLCQMLGIGILEIIGPLKVKETLPVMKTEKRLKNSSKRKLIEEFHGRKVRNAVGGTRGEVLTFYREQALSIAFTMSDEEEVSLKTLREKGIIKPEKYVNSNYYGWFERTKKRGYYRLSEFGKNDILRYKQYRDILKE